MKPTIIKKTGQTLPRPMLPQTALVQSHTLTRAAFDRGMTWPEFKIFGFTVAQITGRDKELVELTVGIGDLCNLAKLGNAKTDHGRYTRVREFLSDITTRGVVVLRKAEDRTEERIYAQLFEEARYNEENGKIVFRLHNRMREHFIQLKSYTFVQHLEEFLNLDSVAQGRLYMLACDCQRMTAPTFRTFTIDDLVSILGLGGAVRKTDPDWRKADRIRRVYKDLRGKNTTLVFYLRTIRQSKKLMMRLDFPKFTHALPKD